MNRTGRGGINMRGGIDATFPLSDEQLMEISLNSAKNVLRIAAENEGCERLAENAWNTIMDIACGSNGERRPFDRHDYDILRAARAVSPDAVLTSGELTDAAYMQDDLGTRFTISGGEVMELDAHLEARYDEQNGGDDLPF